MRKGATVDQEFETVLGRELKVGDLIRHIGSPYVARITMWRPGLTSAIYRTDRYDDVGAIDFDDMIERAALQVAKGGDDNGKG